ncbi:MAG TPA: hypothetical protein VFX70_05460 [Mycobacteriales bacterium]|nr:hypothetical protein [Mycobacteriales bacterium]
MPGGDVAEQRHAESVGVACAAAAVRAPGRLLVRAAMLAGFAVVAWLLCGSTASYAAGATAGGQDVGLSGAGTSARDATSGAVPVPGAVFAAAEPATGSASWVVGFTTRPVRPRVRISRIVPVTRVTPVVPVADVADVTDVTRVARVVRVVRAIRVATLAAAPAAPLLRAVDDPAPLPSLTLHPIAGVTGPVVHAATASVPVLVTGSLGPLDPAGPTSPVVPAGGREGPGPRPSVVPLPAAPPAAHRAPAIEASLTSVGTEPAGQLDVPAPQGTSSLAPARPGPARNPRNRWPDPAGAPPSVPAAPPAPVGASGQAGPTAASVTLPADRGPGAAPGADRPSRHASTGAVRQRTDDPSTTPD